MGEQGGGAGAGVTSADGVGGQGTGTGTPTVGAGGEGGAGKQGGSGAGGAPGEQGQPGKSAGGTTTPQDITLKLPDGFKGGEELDGFRAAAKGAGLTSEQAQGMFDLYLKAQGRQVEAMAQRHQADVEAWKKAVQTDKEMGGARYEGTRAAAQKAISQFGGPELEKLLNDTGLGEHPLLVRFAAKVGAALAEDPGLDHGTGTSGPSNSNSLERVRQLYPNSPDLWPAS